MGEKVVVGQKRKCVKGKKLQWDERKGIAKVGLKKISLDGKEECGLGGRKCSGIEGKQLWEVGWEGCEVG